MSCSHDSGKIKSHVFVYEDELHRLYRLAVVGRHFQCQLSKVTGAVDLTSEKVTEIWKRKMY